MGNGQKGEGITRECETYVYYKTDVADAQHRELLIDFFKATNQNVTPS